MFKHPRILTATLMLLASGPLAAARSDDDPTRILNAHNAARAAVGAPPLQWDPQLAVGAQAYARQLAAGAPFVHSSRVGRENERENLWRGPHRSSPEGMVGTWIDEKRNFIPGIFPNVSRTGNWYDVGHYSQMIWPTTTHVGCGVATGWQWDFFVCRYSPPGNRNGSPVIAVRDAGTVSASAGASASGTSPRK